MATTSPDNLRTPNPTDPYNLVADLAILASDAQAALEKRGNFYMGTSAQRIAFTSAPDGTHWQDTDGPQYEWVRKAGAWRGVTPLSGEVTLTAPSGGGQASTTIAFPAGYFPNPPVVMATAATGAGPTVTLNINVASVTSTGAEVTMNRSNTTATLIRWLATPA